MHSLPLSLLLNISKECLLSSVPTAHLKSKKHHYHVRKKRKSDPSCDQSQRTSAPSDSAGETLSKDSCDTVAPGSGDQTSQDSTGTTHEEVPVTL